MFVARYHTSRSIPHPNLGRRAGWHVVALHGGLILWFLTAFALGRDADTSLEPANPVRDGAVREVRVFFCMPEFSAAETDIVCSGLHNCLATEILTLDGGSRHFWSVRWSGFATLARFAAALLVAMGLLVLAGRVRRHAYYLADQYRVPKCVFRNGTLHVRLPWRLATWSFYLPAVSVLVVIGVWGIFATNKALPGSYVPSLPAEVAWNVVATPIPKDHFPPECTLVDLAGDAAAKQAAKCVVRCIDTLGLRPMAKRTAEGRMLSGMLSSLADVSWQKADLLLFVPSPPRFTVLVEADPGIPVEQLREKLLAGGNRLDVEAIRIHKGISAPAIRYPRSNPLARLASENLARILAAEGIVDLPVKPDGERNSNRLHVSVPLRFRVRFKDTDAPQDRSALLANLEKEFPCRFYPGLPSESSAPGIAFPAGGDMSVALRVRDMASAAGFGKLELRAEESFFLDIISGQSVRRNLVIFLPPGGLPEQVEIEKAAAVAGLSVEQRFVLSPAVCPRLPGFIYYPVSEVWPRNLASRRVAKRLAELLGKIQGREETASGLPQVLSASPDADCVEINLSERLPEGCLSITCDPAMTATFSSAVDEALGFLGALNYTVERVPTGIRLPSCGVVRYPADGSHRRLAAILATLLTDGLGMSGIRLADEAEPELKCVSVNLSYQANGQLHLLASKLQTRLEVHPLKPEALRPFFTEAGWTRSQFGGDKAIRELAVEAAAWNTMADPGWMHRLRGANAFAVVLPSLPDRGGAEATVPPRELVFWCERKDEDLRFQGVIGQPSSKSRVTE